MFEIQKYISGKEFRAGITAEDVFSRRQKSPLSRLILNLFVGNVQSNSAIAHKNDNNCPAISFKKHKKGENMNINPGNINVIRENINVVPGNINVIRENMNVVPGNINVIRENMNVVPGNINVIRENMNVVPGNINVIRENMNIFPVNIIVIRENMNVVPGNVNISPFFMSIDSYHTSESIQSQLNHPGVINITAYETVNNLKKNPGKTGQTMKKNYYS
jgi:hypothetical protein